MTRAEKHLVDMDAMSEGRRVHMNQNRIRAGQCDRECECSLGFCSLAQTWLRLGPETGRQLQHLVAIPCRRTRSSNLERLRLLMSNVCPMQSFTGRWSRVTMQVKRNWTRTNHRGMSLWRQRLWVTALTAACCTDYHPILFQTGHPGIKAWYGWQLRTTPLLDLHEVWKTEHCRPWLWLRQDREGRERNVYLISVWGHCLFVNMVWCRMGVRANSNKECNSGCFAKLVSLHSHSFDGFKWKFCIKFQK